MVLRANMTAFPPIYFMGISWYAYLGEGGILGKRKVKHSYVSPKFSVRFPKTVCFSALNVCVLFTIQHYKAPCSLWFQSYMLALMKGLYEETGFVDLSTDSQLQVYSRVEVLKWACLLGHEHCISNSVRQFQNWRSSPQPDKDNPLVSAICPRDWYINSAM